MEEQSNNPTTVQTVADVLKYGISAYVDSQYQPGYIINDPRYNTERGLAGQGQYGVFRQLTSNPLIVLGIVVAIVVIARR